MKKGQRKKKVNKNELLIGDEFQNAKNDYLSELKSNPTYSLLVDEQNKYNFTPEQKEFIGLYCEFKNLEVAGNMSKLGFENALKFYGTYECQQEIRRLNIASIHHQFKNKMMSLEDIGGYLSSLVVDNVPAGDRINSVEKIKVIDKLIYIHELLGKGYTAPKEILDVDVDEQLKTLSLDALKRLLDSNKNDEALEEKTKIIEELKSYNVLSEEEITLLNSLSVSELNELIDEIDKRMKESKS